MLCLTCCRYDRAYLCRRHLASHSVPCVTVCVAVGAARPVHQVWLCAASPGAVPVVVSNGWRGRMLAANDRWAGSHANAALLLPLFRRDGGALGSCGRHDGLAGWVEHVDPKTPVMLVHMLPECCCRVIHKRREGLNRSNGWTPVAMSATHTSLLTPSCKTLQIACGVVFCCLFVNVSQSGVVQHYLQVYRPTLQAFLYPLLGVGEHTSGLCIGY